MRGQELGHRAAVLLVLPNAQRQRPDAAQNQEALERRHYAAGCFLDQEIALLVFGLRSDEHAAQPVRVAVEVLGGRVHHDIGAQRQRALQRRRQEGVVHAHFRAARVRNLGTRRQCR